MAKTSKATDKKIRRRPLRRQWLRGRQQAEADEQHGLAPVEQRDTGAPAVELAENRLALTTRQGLAQSIAQRQGNGRMQRLIGIVQRKKAAVQRKKKPMITTPVGKEAKQLKSGARQLLINGVLVTILPDKVSKDKKLAGRAETTFTLDWGKLPGYQHKGGLVTKVDGKMPSIQMTVQTTYGAGATAEDPSAYGRGTTKEGKAAGNTSLGFHEGRHGLDYLTYLKENPLPQFLGKVGMKVAAYQAAMGAYQQATQEYATRMGAASQAKTDCVGTKASFCVVE